MDEHERGVPASADAGHHHRRDPGRMVHADGSGGGRLPVRTVSGILLPGPQVEGPARDLLGSRSGRRSACSSSSLRPVFSAGSPSIRRIPDQIILSADGHERHPAGVMAMIIVIVLILGCFLEGNAIFIITIPIFLPIASAVRDRPRQFRRRDDPADHGGEPDAPGGDVPLRGFQFQQGQYRNPVQGGPRPI